VERKRCRVKILKKLKSSGLSIKRGKGNKGGAMPITKTFRNTILKRAKNDASFRRNLLTEAVNEFISGDLNAGKAILRDYINATITFQELAKRLKKSSKSIHRMLGSAGNPRAENILEIIKILQEHEHVTLEVKAKRQAA
jgi:DNA-binding phage protein